MEEQHRHLQQQKERPQDRKYVDLHRQLATEQQVPQRTAGGVCPNCGSAVDSGARFCEECGYPLGSGQCANCHATIDASLALCPHCGHPAHAGQCSFCGEQMDADEQFCSACGNPRQGIPCPTCGTLNFRSFCRQCNTPLNEMAQRALVKARNNPAVQRAQRIAQELAQLEERLLQLAESTGDDAQVVLPDDQPQEVSEEQKALLNKYTQVLNNFHAAPVVSQVRRAVTTARPSAIANIDLLKAALEAYEAKAAEMQAAFSAMVPDASEPPEEQRNFLCACMIETYSTTKTKVKQPAAWICNLCGCRHSQPSECARPELGGQWVYEDREVVTTIKTKMTIYQ